MRHITIINMLHKLINNKTLFQSIQIAFISFLEYFQEKSS